MTLTPLFDTLADITRPDVPTILPHDNARTRATDPVTSHLAADQSQRLLHETKLHVLQVLDVNPDTVGSEINDLYRFMGARKGWNRVAHDTPRKRAGELVDDGYLEVVGTRLASNGTQESVYRLSEKGQRVVNLGINR